MSHVNGANDKTNCSKSTTSEAEQVEASGAAESLEKLYLAARDENELLEFKNYELQFKIQELEQSQRRMLSAICSNVVVAANEQVTTAEVGEEEKVAQANNDDTTGETPTPTSWPPLDEPVDSAPPELPVEGEEEQCASESRAKVTDGHDDDDEAARRPAATICGHQFVTIDSHAVQLEQRADCVSADANGRLNGEHANELLRADEEQQQVKVEHEEEINNDRRRVEKAHDEQRDKYDDGQDDKSDARKTNRSSRVDAVTSVAQVHERGRKLIEYNASTNTTVSTTSSTRLKASSSASIKAPIRSTNKASVSTAKMPPRALTKSQPNLNNHKQRGGARIAMPVQAARKSTGQISQQRNQQQQQQHRQSAVNCALGARSKSSLEQRSQQSTGTTKLARRQATSCSKSTPFVTHIPSLIGQLHAPSATRIVRSTTTNKRQLSKSLANLLPPPPPPTTAQSLEIDGSRWPQLVDDVTQQQQQQVRQDCVQSRDDERSSSPASVGGAITQSAAHCELRAHCGECVNLRARLEALGEERKQLEEQVSELEELENDSRLASQTLGARVGELEQKLAACTSDCARACEAESKLRFQNKRLHFELRQRHECLQSLQYQLNELRSKSKSLARVNQKSPIVESSAAAAAVVAPTSGSTSEDDSLIGAEKRESSSSSLSASTEENNTSVSSKPAVLYDSAYSKSGSSSSCSSDGGAADLSSSAANSEADSSEQATAVVATEAPKQSLSDDDDEQDEELTNWATKQQQLVVRSRRIATARILRGAQVHAQLKHNLVTQEVEEEVTPSEEPPIVKQSTPIELALAGVQQLERPLDRELCEFLHVVSDKKELSEHDDERQLIDGLKLEVSNLRMRLLQANTLNDNLVLELKSASQAARQQSQRSSLVEIGNCATASATQQRHSWTSGANQVLSNDSPARSSSVIYVNAAGQLRKQQCQCNLTKHDHSRELVNFLKFLLDKVHFHHGRTFELVSECQKFAMNALLASYNHQVSLLHHQRAVAAGQQALARRVQESQHLQQQQQQVAGNPIVPLDKEQPDVANYPVRPPPRRRANNSSNKQLSSDTTKDCHDIDVPLSPLQVAKQTLYSLVPIYYSSSNNNNNKQLETCKSESIAGNNNSNNISISCTLPNASRQQQQQQLFNNRMVVVNQQRPNDIYATVCKTAKTRPRPEQCEPAVSVLEINSSNTTNARSSTTTTSGSNVVNITTRPQSALECHNPPSSHQGANNCVFKTINQQQQLAGVKNSLSEDMERFRVHSNGQLLDLLMRQNWCENLITDKIKSIEQRLAMNFSNSSNNNNQNNTVIINGSKCQSITANEVATCGQSISTFVSLPRKL